MKKDRLGLSSILLALTFVLAMAQGVKASTLTFSNTAPITINDDANATPYPATLTISGLNVPILDLNVTLSVSVIHFQAMLAFF